VCQDSDASAPILDASESGSQLFHKLPRTLQITPEVFLTLNRLGKTVLFLEFHRSHPALVRYPGKFITDPIARFIEQRMVLVTDKVVLEEVRNSLESAKNAVDRCLGRYRFIEYINKSFENPELNHKIKASAQDHIWTYGFVPQRQGEERAGAKNTIDDLLENVEITENILEVQTGHVHDSSLQFDFRGVDDEYSSSCLGAHWPSFSHHHDVYHHTDHPGYIIGWVLSCRRPGNLPDRMPMSKSFTITSGGIMKDTLAITVSPSHFIAGVRASRTLWRCKVYTVEKSHYQFPDLIAE